MASKFDHDQKTSSLCTRCGLCCDGSLFSDVELKGSSEADSMEFLGLEVEEEESHRHVLIQPCRALKKRCCNIYAHRPESCRTFVCLALERVRQNELSLEEALRIVEKIRHLKTSGQKASATTWVRTHILGPDFSN